MSEPTYTDRRITKRVLKRKEKTAVVSEDGWGSGAPSEVIDILEVGDTYELETKGFNRISGYRIGGVWYGRKSDQEIEAEDKKAIDESRKKHVAYVESQREDWTRREEALPDWAKEIMKMHRDRAAERNEDFDVEFMGWGYTLTALELAVLYSGHEEIVNSVGRLQFLNLPDDVMEFMTKHGVSGNQDDWALFVAKNRKK